MITESELEAYARTIPQDLQTLQAQLQKFRLTFFVPGIAKPAGSKRGFYIEKIKRVVITDACKTSRDWKTTVSWTARENYRGAPLTGPLELTLRFQVLRPKSHFGSGKNAGNVKEGAPAYPVAKPDVLKLTRAVEDALTGIIYQDDAQIVSEHLSKVYDTNPGVWIQVAVL